MRWISGLAVLVSLPVLAAPPAKSAPAGAAAAAAEQERTTYRKQMGDSFNQFLDSMATARKQLETKPAEAGSVAMQARTFIEGFELQLGMAERAGVVRAKDTFPTRKGALTSAGLRKELAKIRRELSDSAIGYGDKAAKLERLAVLERSYDWQVRQVAGTAGYEKAGRMRGALALAKARGKEAVRFEKLADDSRKAKALTDATELAIPKGKKPFPAVLAEVKKLAQAAAKDEQRLAPLAAAEQKRADEAHRAQAKAKPAPGGRPAAASPAAPVWREDPVPSPLQTEAGEPEVEASPEPETAAPAEEPAAQAAPAAPPAPQCLPSGAVCGDKQHPEEVCCPGSSCVDRFQYSDGEQGLGRCN